MASRCGGVRLGLIGLVVAGVLEGCLCEAPKRECEYLRSEVVFVGRAAARTSYRWVSPGEKDSRQADFYSYRFNVEQLLAGQVGEIVDVRSAVGDGACGMRFELGKQYVIFASYQKGELWTGLCTGTEELRPDAATISKLRNWIESGRGTIFGRAFREARYGNEGTGVGNIRVTVTGNGAIQTIVTGRDGSYQFSGLAPGEYLVRADKPPGLEYERKGQGFRFRVPLKAGQCADVRFGFFPVGSPPW